MRRLKQVVKQARIPWHGTCCGRPAAPASIGALARTAIAWARVDGDLPRAHGTRATCARAEPTAIAGQLEASGRGDASRRGMAMYWLLAHWLFGNAEELAEAVALTASHPSRLVAALREHVAGHDARQVYGQTLDTIFEAIRLAAR